MYLSPVTARSVLIFEFSRVSKPIVDAAQCLIEHMKEEALLQRYQLSSTPGRPLVTSR